VLAAKNQAAGIRGTPAPAQSVPLARPRGSLFPPAASE
jgi:hypothetical protein